jgi:monofunctional biosynthetic peptidoglycan transglycosylase
LWEGRSYIRKGLEAYLTLLIEAAWPKRRILEMYLNVVQFGPFTFGAEAAAQRFFQKPACDLTAAESALLVAALSSPSKSHVDAPERLMRYRQLLILGGMRKLRQHYLTWLERRRA